MGRWRRVLTRLRGSAWRARDHGQAGRGQPADEKAAGGQAAGAPGGGAADHEPAGPPPLSWRAYDQRRPTVGSADVARRFPALIGQAVSLGWSANRRDTLATITLPPASGVVGCFALFATPGALQALFPAAPTPHRVRAALPSLILVAVAPATRS